MGIALEGQKSERDSSEDVQGFTVVYEDNLKGYIRDAVVDYRKSWFGEAGFVVETGYAC